MLSQYELLQWGTHDLKILCKDLHPKKNFKTGWSKEEMVHLIMSRQDSALFQKILLEDKITMRKS